MNKISILTDPETTILEVTDKRKILNKHQNIHHDTFMVAKNWRQSRRPSNGGWLNLVVLECNGILIYAVRKQGVR